MEVTRLNKKIDSLKTQLKKCDDWVNMIEEDWYPKRRVLKYVYIELLK